MGNMSDEMGSCVLMVVSVVPLILGVAFSTSSARPAVPPHLFEYFFHDLHPGVVQLIVFQPVQVVRVYGFSDLQAGVRGSKSSVL